MTGGTGAVRPCFRDEARHCGHGRHGGRPSSAAHGAQIRYRQVYTAVTLWFSMRRLSPLSAILIGGAIAGALDITYAIGFSAMRGVAPSRILQSVASGLLGAPAFEGGVATAALGLVLHFCIAFLWAAIFYLASRAITFLTRHPVVSGLFYGVLIYAAMNLVVLPLSAFRAKSRSRSWSWLPGSWFTCFASAFPSRSRCAGPGHRMLDRLSTAEPFANAVMVAVLAAPRCPGWPRKMRRASRDR